MNEVRQWIIPTDHPPDTLPEDLLEFLQDREGIDHPLPEVARYFRVAEWAVLSACQTLYAARHAITVTVLESRMTGSDGVIVIGDDMAEWIACFWIDESRPATTREVALAQEVSEHKVLSMLIVYRHEGVFDVTIRAEVDPWRERGAQFIGLPEEDAA